MQELEIKNLGRSMASFLLFLSCFDSLVYCKYLQEKSSENRKFCSESCCCAAVPFLLTAAVAVFRGAGRGGPGRDRAAPPARDELVSARRL